MESPLRHSVMLDDLTRNLQQLAASLPPDEWDEGPPRIALRREPSGFFSVRELRFGDDERPLRRRERARTVSPANRTCRGLVQEKDAALEERSRGKRRGWISLFRPRRRDALAKSPAPKRPHHAENSFLHRLKRRLLHACALRKQESEEGKETDTGPLLCEKP
jgi:hypothetical protein